MELRNVECPRGCGYNPRLVSTVAQFNLEKHLKHDCILRPGVNGKVADGLPILAESGETENVTKPANSTRSTRTFETGATRDQDADKLEYEGFLSPLVLRRYAEYMHEHRFQSDGTLRAADNWQKGMPFDSFMSSGWRHFMDWWLNHRDYEAGEEIEVALCAIIFNASGYLHELLKENR